MARVIDYRDLPRLMATSARGIKRAGVEALNASAFKILAPLAEQASSDLKFRKANPRRAVGWQVEKANVATMHAAIQTKRGWLEYHLGEGTRHARQGWEAGGRSWLVIPADGARKWAFDSKGRIRSNIIPQLFPAIQGGKGLLLRRDKRGSKEARLVAILVPSAQYHEDYKAEQRVRDEFEKTAPDLFRRYLDNPRLKTGKRGV